MNNKQYWPEEQETKHKKKAKSKGLPRADHKHIYETVLLTSRYHGTDFKTGKERISETILPTKVCIICGRISHTDRDPKYYVRNYISNLPFKTYKEELSEEALSLPKWLAEDFWDKFAIKID